MGEKIKYGVSNVHCAVATIASAGTATYGDVFAMPGCTHITLDQESERTVFYADNIEYWVGMNNHGYSGSIEFALIPDKFKTDVLGYLVDNKGVLLEDADAPIKHFALMFEFATDVKARRHVLYNCTCSRPSVSGDTKEENITPQTETLDLEAKTVYNSAINKNLVKANSMEDTDTTTYNGWYSAVYQPAALDTSSASTATTS